MWLLPQGACAAIVACWVELVEFSIWVCGRNARSWQLTLPVSAIIFSVPDGDFLKELSELLIGTCQALLLFRRTIKALTIFLPL